jgi:hypothetical protein
MKGISIYEEDIESRGWQGKEMMPCILTALGRN